MEFNKMYQKVKYIVRKCEKEYYIQLWEKDDWEQEGQLTLFELYQKNPEIETNEETCGNCSSTGEKSLYYYL